MKAQNLTISIPNYGCNKNCPYCVSAMTGYMESNPILMQRNIKKVIKMAETAQISNVLFTSKGEIFFSDISINTFLIMAKLFDKWPIEVQTNGLVFSYETKRKVMDIMSEMKNSGINIIAISIDSMFQFRELTYIIKEYPGFIYRATVNVTDDLGNVTFSDIIKETKSAGFRQLSFRQVTVPNYGIQKSEKAGKAIEWIFNNTKNDYVLLGEVNENLMNNGRIIRKLPYGSILYDYKDLSVTNFNYCIQDSSNDDDIRSLIFQEDGHLYTTWNSKASIIF